MNLNEEVKLSGYDTNQMAHESFANIESDFIHLNEALVELKREINNNPQFPQDKKEEIENDFNCVREIYNRKNNNAPVGVGDVLVVQKLIKKYLQK